MDFQMLTEFFMWCTILNCGLMILSFILVISMMDFIYKKHTHWFPMSRETFNVVMYSYLGIYKIGIILFNLVPWLALLILGK